MWSVLRVERRAEPKDARGAREPLISLPIFKYITARLQTVNMRCDLRHPFPPAARAAGHIERFVRVAHSSQPGAADSFCAPTAGDAVLPLS